MANDQAEEEEEVEEVGAVAETGTKAELNFKEKRQSLIVVTRTMRVVSTFPINLSSFL